MTREDSLHFVQERLRQQHASTPLTRERRMHRRPRVMRRFVARLERGEGRDFERVDGSVLVRCASGTLWITHDGDCKDVILSADESYRAERDQAMHLYALQPTVLEIEFEDEVLPH